MRGGGGTWQAVGLGSKAGKENKMDEIQIVKMKGGADVLSSKAVAGFTGVSKESRLVEEEASQQPRGSHVRA